MRKCILTLFLFTLSGAAQSQTGIIKDGSLFMKYLSDTERTDFFSEQLQSDMLLDQNLVSPGRGGVNTITIPISSGGQESRSGKSTETSAAEAIEYVGEISCVVYQHYPHATDLDWIRVVKAKSSGSCAYIPVPNTGPHPPTLKWDLVQILAGPTEVGQIHPRIGYSPAWSDSVAYVATECVNGAWAHGDYMMVTLPPGWYFGNGASTVYWLMGVVQNYISTC